MAIKRQGSGLQIYPVHVEITYASGRTETLIVKDRWEEHKKDLQICREEGTIADYKVAFAWQRAAWNAGG